jgi:hypothetical protein
VTTTALDVKFLALAKRMIDKYGKAVTFYPLTVDSDGSAYDVNTGTTTAADGTAVVTKGVFSISKDTTREGVRLGSRLLYVPAQDFETTPKTGDKVTFDSADLRVVDIDIYYSGEQAALYGVFVRKP